jgi:hypothetical protein
LMMRTTVVGRSIAAVVRRLWVEGLREDDLDVADLPVKLAGYTADDRARHVRPLPVAVDRHL